jgi:hypothetical protein
VDQLLHRVQTEETDYVSILATGSRSFQAWTAVVTQGHKCDNSVAISAEVFEIFVSWAEKFSATFSSRLIHNIKLKYSCTKNTLFSKVYLSRGMFLYRWKKTDKCIHQQ